MKSIRTTPTSHAAEGDERIRTAEQALGADPAYVDRCPFCGGDAADNWFDRSLCQCDGTDWGVMHQRCSNCGCAADCAFDVARAEPRDA